MSMIETVNDVTNSFLSRREITCKFRGLAGKLKKSEAVDMITKELKLDGKTVLAINLKNETGRANISGIFYVYDDENLAKTSKHLTTTAKVPHSWHYVHDQVGYNYRLPNINAALGCAQLEQLPAFLGKKRSLADSYRQVFSKIEGIHFFTEPTFAQSNYWLNVLILDKGHGHQRDPLLELTNSQGVMTRPAWQLMHKLKMFTKSSQ